MPITKVCPICQSIFSIRPSRIKQGKGRYCSRPCFNKSRLAITEQKYIGKKFGKLTVIERTTEDYQKWLCQCDCGNQAIVRIHAIAGGDTVSCGCRKREIGEQRAAQYFNGPKLIETGSKFTRWTVIKGKSVDGRYRYLCECDCGEHRWISQRSLVTGDSKSCGCYHREVSRLHAKRMFTTHGLSYTPEYKRYWRHQRLESDSNWTLEMELLLRELQPECMICGSTDRLAIDHVVPVTKGGKLEPGNVVRLCKQHNSAKHNKNLSDLPLAWTLMIDYAAQSFQDVWLA